MKRWAVVSGICLCGLGSSVTARAAGEADGGGTDRVPGARAQLVVQDGGAIPGLARPGAGAAARVEIVGGYDTANDRPSLEASAEVRLHGPLSLRGGVSRSAASDALRPAASLRVQALTQRQSGVNLAFSVGYRAEGFYEPEGEVELTVAVGRRAGRVTGVATVTYGQDPEGDDFEASAALALLVALPHRTYVGVAARGRQVLATEAADGVTGEVLVGPLLTWAVGRWALTAQAGLSVVARTPDGVDVGPAMLGGLVSVF